MLISMMTGPSLEAARQFRRITIHAAEATIHRRQARVSFVRSLKRNIACMESYMFPLYSVATSISTNTISRSDLQRLTTYLVFFVTITFSYVALISVRVFLDFSFPGRVYQLKKKPPPPLFIQQRGGAVMSYAHRSVQTMLSSGQCRAVVILFSLVIVILDYRHLDCFWIPLVLAAWGVAEVVYWCISYFVCLFRFVSPASPLFTQHAFLFHSIVIYPSFHCSSSSFWIPISFLSYQFEAKLLVIASPTSTIFACIHAIITYLFDILDQFPISSSLSVSST